MPQKRRSQKIDQKIIKELKALNKENHALAKEVKKIKSLEFMKVFKHPVKFMWFSLLKGLMIGLGTVLGASVLVGLLIYLLARISFVPIIGDFVEDILFQIESSQVQEEKPFIDQYQDTKNGIIEEGAPIEVEPN